MRSYFFVFGSIYVNGNVNVQIRYPNHLLLSVRGDGMEIIQGYAEYGVFAGLFVSLLLYTLKENEKRENMYREIIKNLSESFKCLADDVCEIKERLNEMLKK